MNEPTTLLTGIPRSGTTLVCHLLSRLPDVVALHEPIRIADLPAGPVQGLLDPLARFAAETRHRLITEATAQSKQIGGAVPDNPIAQEKSDDGLRKAVNEIGTIGIAKPLSRGFHLVIKHNALFTVALDVLCARYRCFAVIRNPLAVLASWRSVDLPVHRGRIPAAEARDPDLAARLSADAPVEDKQLFILDWFFDRFHRLLSPDRIIRYEEVVATGGRCLAGLAPAASILPAQLASRNASALYDRAHILSMGRLLLERDGAFRHFYADADIEAVMASAATNGC